MISVERHDGPEDTDVGRIDWAPGWYAICDKDGWLSGPHETEGQARQAAVLAYLQREPEDDPDYAEILADCTRDLAALGFPASVARENWQQAYERAIEQARTARLYATVYARLAAKEQGA